MTTVSDQVDRTIAGERVLTKLCTLFSGIALLLASIGLYGVMAYSVANRISEIGIRMALGTSHRDVRWMVLRQSVAVVSIGIVAGVGGAMVAARLVGGGGGRGSAGAGPSRYSYRPDAGFALRVARIWCLKGGLG